MRHNKAVFIIGFFLFALLGILLSCATDKTPLSIENRLSQSELAYYSDSFDEMREDLWDRAGYLYRDEQVQNFKQAHMNFENGKLIIRTQTGSFSKGGLSSRYSLRGDFDIQLDCRLNFIKGLNGMDQLFSLGLFDIKKGKMNHVIIGLSIRDGVNQGYLFSTAVINGKWRKGNSKQIENFDGSFRINRTGNSLSTLYKINSATEWNRLDTFRATDKDMLIGFQLRNFFLKRTAIRATHSISVEIDGLKINAAREIIEDEI